MHMCGCGCEDTSVGMETQIIDGGIIFCWIIDSRSIDESILDGSIRCTGQPNPNVSMDLEVKIVLCTSQPHSRGRPEHWL